MFRAGGDAGLFFFGELGCTGGGGHRSDRDKSDKCGTSGKQRKTPRRTRANTATLAWFFLLLHVFIFIY
jgi:hypothetical protein